MGPKPRRRRRFRKFPTKAIVAIFLATISFSLMLIFMIICVSSVGGMIEEFPMVLKDDEGYLYEIPDMMPKIPLSSLSIYPEDDIRAANKLLLVPNEPPTEEEQMRTSVSGDVLSVAPRKKELPVAVLDKRKEYRNRVTAPKGVTSSMSIDSDSDKPQVDDSIARSCNVKNNSNGDTWNYKWTLPGQNKSQGYELRVPDLGENQIGWYRCTATNDKGQKISKTFKNDYYHGSNLVGRLRIFPVSSGFSSAPSMKCSLL